MTNSRSASAAGSARDERSRRGFLETIGAGTATVGLAALAGCASFTDDGSESASFHAADLPDVGDDPQPVTWATYPMGIPREYRRDAQARTNDLLEGVPTPLSARHVPNGHVRQHLTEAVSAARDHLDDATIAPTQRGTIDSLRRARQHARFAAAGWAAIDEDLTVDDVAADANDVTDRARRARADMEYVGSDVVPAVVVHASREALLADAVDVSQDFSHGDGVRVLQVAEYAEHVERASASLADATMLAERFHGTQPEDAGSLAARIEDARAALADVLRSEQSSLPSERDALTVADGDIDNTLAQRVLYDLHRRAVDDDPADSRDGPARGIVRGIEAYAALEGYRRVRERVESGERYEIIGAAAVTEHYEAVHEALARAPRRSDAPGLARAALVNVVASVQHHDQRLADLDGEVHDHDVTDAVESYVLQNAIARNVPEAVDAALDALQR
jgi:hypothetical protein